MKIYDKKKQCLVVYERRASPGFWDKHWHQASFIDQVRCTKNSLIENLLKKYAPSKSSRVLEAGCGNGRFVYLMNYLGYRDAYGIDYARRTVNLLNDKLPQLKISCQEVALTTFKDDFFDLYISLGVIEHDRAGFTKIISEAQRLVRSGGFLAVSFPYISPLRSLKIRLGFYRDKQVNEDNFYQYIYDQDVVLDKLAEAGLQLIEKFPYDPLKGLTNELPGLKKILLYLTQRFSWLHKLASRFLLPISGHMMMLVLENKR